MSLRILLLLLLLLFLLVHEELNVGKRVLVESRSSQAFLVVLLNVVGNLVSILVVEGVFGAQVGHCEVETHSEESCDVRNTGSYLLKCQTEIQAKEGTENLLIVVLSLCGIKE
jgi:Mg2+/Co2+ transporter CorC